MAVGGRFCSLGSGAKRTSRLLAQASASIGTATSPASHSRLYLTKPRQPCTLLRGGAKRCSTTPEPKSTAPSRPTVTSKPTSAGCCWKECGCTKRRRAYVLAVAAAAFTALLIASLAASILTWTSDGDICFSLSYEDGIGPGCAGMSEYNRNLPHTQREYKAAIDVINGIALKVPPA